MPHPVTVHIYDLGESKALQRVNKALRVVGCLLYTSDAADE